MAKWGEGDPRWVVESRPDGTNVNGWHWEEKNRMDWSRQRLSEVLCGLTCCSGRARVTALKDLSGAAAVCTRKGGKKFVTYELTVELSWEGTVSEKKVKGEIKISEFACVNDPDEYVFSITTKTSGDDENELKKDWRKSKDSICAMLAQYISDLHAS
ncbi:hypothetical protein BSKO_08837 [Bryopsis sp. KO-2023]|nr:hypothetical protein BSKO_08837 [Bryopsis sp. KO-2023]